MAVNSTKTIYKDTKKNSSHTERHTWTIAQAILLKVHIDEIKYKEKSTSTATLVYKKKKTTLLLVQICCDESLSSAVLAMR